MKIDSNWMQVCVYLFQNSDPAKLFFYILVVGFRQQILNTRHSTSGQGQSVIHCNISYIDKRLLTYSISF